MSNYEKLKKDFMKVDEFVTMYKDAKNRVDLEYEVQCIKDEITNDKFFNVLNALDALQKHIVDFTHKRKLA